MNSHISRHGHNLSAAAILAFALTLVLPIIGSAQQPAEQRVEGTAWAVNDVFGGSYIFEFGSGGAFRATSSDGTASKGSWKQEGNSISIKIDGKTVEYAGTIKDKLIKGGIKNQSGDSLLWWARLQEATPVSSDAPVPKYPPIAIAAHSQGVVTVEVKVDKEGHVTSASAISGNPLLQQTSFETAKLWEFNSGKYKEARTTRLFFIFHLLPRDCKKPAGDAPAPKFISSYQVEIKRYEACVETDLVRP
jgi:TonB family protein